LLIQHHPRNPKMHHLQQKLTMASTLDMLSWYVSKKTLLAWYRILLFLRGGTSGCLGQCKSKKIIIIFRQNG
jgi:hypothetical protein